MKGGRPDFRSVAPAAKLEKDCWHVPLLPPQPPKGVATLAALLKQHRNALDCA